MAASTIHFPLQIMGGIGLFRGAAQQGYLAYRAPAIRAFQRTHFHPGGIMAGFAAHLAVGQAAVIPPILGNDRCWPACHRVIVMAAG